MSVEVSVIIVTWNARELVDRCLEAVLGEGGAGVDLEVLIVDNDSSDDTVAHVEQHWPARDPRVRVLQSGRNGGMAFGNNVGMLAAAGRSFLLLNSDAFLEPGCLRTLVERLEAERATTAAVVPALRNVDGSPQRSVRGFPTPWRYATEFWYLRKLAPRSRALNAFYGGGLDLSREQRIDWATGACMLVPREAVDEVGLMDEAYVMYGEEVDWFARMAAVGRSVRWVPSASAVHVGGGSAKVVWNRLYGMQLANHVRYMAGNASLRAARRTKRIIVSALWLRAIAYRVGGAARRERAAAFARGARHVRSIDPARPEPAVVPPWPGSPDA